MICVHCNETISVWHSVFRGDGGFKCSVCGKVSFAQLIHRRDPIAAFVFLGYIAVIMLLLFLFHTPKTRDLWFLWAMAGSIALSIAIDVFRASQRIVTVASRPPRPIRQQRWFSAAWLVLFISILLGDLVMGWSYVSRAGMMIAALFYIVGCFYGRPSRTRPTDPFKQD